MGGRQHDHRHLRIAAMLLGHGVAHGGVRIERLAEALAAVGDGGERALLVEPAGIEQRAHAAQRIGADLERAGAAEGRPSHRPAPCRSRS